MPEKITEKQLRNGWEEAERLTAEKRERDDRLRKYAKSIKDKEDKK